MWDIIEQIWEMPWYEVFVVAIADDIILALKMWWLWAAIFAWVLIWYIRVTYKYKKEGF